MKKPPKKTAAAKKGQPGKQKKVSKGKGRFKRIVLRILLGLLILLILMPVAHYFVFPQQTRAILIDYSSFKKDGRIYFSSETKPEKIDSLKKLIQQAFTQMVRVWGSKTCNPKFIYCDSDVDFTKYGSANPVPAITIMKLGSYIVLSKEGLDLDIIAHEMSHAELYERIGFYAQEFKIPTWFSEGLAMQCDNRNFYSEDTLRMKSDNFKNIPEVKRLKSAKEFHSGTHEEVMLNFMAAKHEVKGWNTDQKLKTFVALINAGKSFEKAYVQVDEK